LSFSKIVELTDKENFFSDILKQLDFTETVIKDIWQEAEKECKEKISKEGKETEVVGFEKFYQFLSDKYLVLDKNSDRPHYLKQALRLPILLKATEPDPKYITCDNFGTVCRLFKFTGEKDKEGFIQRIVEVFKAEWFYGCVDRPEVEKQLELYASKKDSSAFYFIVRYANSKQLCITFRKGSKSFEHANVDPVIAMREGGYFDYVKNFQKTKLKHELIPTLVKTFKPYSKTK